jgi:hypothetical protein
MAGSGSNNDNFHHCDFIPDDKDNAAQANGDGDGDPDQCAPLPPEGALR